MYWKVACNVSPRGVALKQLTNGFILRELSGTATFYTYKDFPHVNRPATVDELQDESGYFPMTKPLSALIR